MNLQNEIQNPVFKAGSAWVLVGVSSWADAASMMSFIAAAMAALYSLLLVSEWWWKKLWRPMLISLGYLPADRRADDLHVADDQDKAA